LNAPHKLALKQHSVGYGPEKDRQHHGDLQATQQEKDQEAHKFSGPHRGNALYQGTTLVGPFRPNIDLGF
jgi:hypothetical protein